MDKDTVGALRMVLAYLVALTFIIGGFWFLYEVYLDTRTAALPDNAQGVVLAVVGFMGSAMTWVFGSATTAASARQSERAHQAGTVAGLAMPESAKEQM